MQALYHAGRPTCCWVRHWSPEPWCDWSASWLLSLVWHSVTAAHAPGLYQPPSSLCHSAWQMPLLHSGLLSLPPALVLGCSHQCWQCLVLMLVHLIEGGAVCPEKSNNYIKSTLQEDSTVQSCLLHNSVFFLYPHHIFSVHLYVCLCVCVCVCAHACVHLRTCMCACLHACVC